MFEQNKHLALSFVNGINWYWLASEKYVLHPFYNKM